MSLRSAEPRRGCTPATQGARLPHYTLTADAEDEEHDLRAVRERFGLNEEIVERHHELLARSLAGPLTAAEKAEFEELQAKFSLLETEEARLIDTSFARTRAGQLQDLLGRIERYIDDFRRAPEQRS